MGWNYTLKCNTCDSSTAFCRISGGRFTVRIFTQGARYPLKESWPPAKSMNFDLWLTQVWKGSEKPSLIIAETGARFMAMRPRTLSVKYIRLYSSSLLICFVPRDTTINYYLQRSPQAKVLWLSVCSTCHCHLNAATGFCYSGFLSFQ